MKNKILSYVLGWVLAVLLCMGWVWWIAFAQDRTTTPESECDGIKLNTNFPIIWNCIETKSEATNPTNAFPYMLKALTKIIMSVILVVCFILIIVSWILWSMNKTKEAKWLIKRVAITILLLWFSGVILKLVNPNFFY